MGTVGADEIAGAHRRLLAALVGQRDGHPVGVLLEAREPHTPLDADPAHGEFVAQNPLGRVLRDRDEAERHVIGQLQVELRDSLTVDIDELAAHRDRRIEDVAQYAHALEHLERARLYANGFRVLRRLEQRVDDSAVDAAASQFDGRGHPDRACSGNEDLGFGGVGHG